MWPDPQFPANEVPFTEEILNGKFQFVCSDIDSILGPTKSWPTKHDNLGEPPYIFISYLTDQCLPLRYQEGAASITDVHLHVILTLKSLGSLYQDWVRNPSQCPLEFGVAVFRMTFSPKSWHQWKYNEFWYLHLLSCQISSWAYHSSW